MYVVLFVHSLHEVYFIFCTDNEHTRFILTPYRELNSPFVGQTYSHSYFAPSPFKALARSLAKQLDEAAKRPVLYPIFNK
jgi:hypothetical protein